VLIVDDNEANREILEQQFDSWKAETDSACSADEALELLDAAEKAGSNFDLAVLDVHMPEKDGIELARAIRGRKNLSQPKLMLLSSVMAPASDDVIRELDISGQLTKPIRQSHLYDAIVRLLNERVAESMRIAALSPLVRMVGRVLLVEDNPVNQAVATGMLEALGVTVEVAENGEEAIEKVTSAAFDVVLMDCQMPVMDGFEATGFIRDHEQREGKSAVPIIALTANALKGDRENCLAAGMDDYLSKPFTGEELHSVLSQYLKVLPGSASKNPGKVSDERADSMLQQRSLP
jgi:CheY-like chemotaxis protein